MKSLVITLFGLSFGLLCISHATAGSEHTPNRTQGRMEYPKVTIQYPYREKVVSSTLAERESFDDLLYVERDFSYVWEDLDTKNAWITCLRTEYVPLRTTQSEPLYSSVADDYSNIVCQEIDLNRVTHSSISNRSDNLQYHGEDLTMQRHWMEESASARSLDCIYASTLIGQQCWRFFSGDGQKKQKAQNVQRILEEGLFRLSALDTHEEANYMDEAHLVPHYGGAPNSSYMGDGE